MTTSAERHEEGERLDLVTRFGDEILEPIHLCKSVLVLQSELVSVTALMEYRNEWLMGMTLSDFVRINGLSAILDISTMGQSC